MASLPKAIIIGTLYTLLSFAVALFLLHCATMFWFHQTGVAFLSDMDASRSAIQQQAAVASPGSFQDIFLRDKVYYFIITLIIASGWLANINHQWKKED